MNKTLEKKSLQYIFTIGFFILMCILAILTDGTGGDGDSVHHYLYSSLAFKHPENFFNHWAKPMFVILSAPFTQFGFIGMKIFNALCVSGCIWLLFELNSYFGVKRKWLAPAFLCAMPHILLSTHSGLTEPLFAFWLLISIYYYTTDRPLLATILISFLPMVRSEGLIIFIPIIIYLLNVREYKLLPLLAIGHLAIGIIGSPIHGTIFWTVSEIPYLKLNTNYGNGDWGHYFSTFHEVTGRAICLLVLIGVLYGAFYLYDFIKSKFRNNIQLIWLIYGSFVCFFMAHVVFWKFGMFNSFGLYRVMVCVLPLAALIATFPIDALEKYLESRRIMWFGNLVLPALILVLSFDYYKKCNFNEYLEKSPLQVKIDEIANKYKEYYKKEGYIFYWDAVYPNMAFDVDRFNLEEYRSGEKIHSMPIPVKAVYLWDDWFSPVEVGNTLEKMKADKRFEEKDVFSVFDVNGGRTRYFYLFETILDQSASKDTILKLDLLQGYNVTNTKEYMTHDLKVGKIFNKANEYSENLKYGFIAGNQDFIKVAIKSNIYSEEIPKETWNNSSFVIVSEDKDGKIIEWKGIPIENQTKLKEWTAVNSIANIKVNKQEANRITCYIWSPTSHTILADSLIVKIEKL